MSSLDGLGLETARPSESSRDMGKKKLGAKTTDRRRTFFAAFKAMHRRRNGQPVKMPHIRYHLYCEKEREHQLSLSLLSYLFVRMSGEFLSKMGMLLLLH